MTLGQRITHLRTAHNLTQEQLAEQLGVSRQSVSKWETDASMPELDKLVKLSQIFSLSLDELVKGEAPAPPDPPPSPAPGSDTPQHTTGFSKQQVVGLVLLVLGVLLALLPLFFGGGLVGVVLAVPFLLCALWCWKIRRYTGLWCLWTVYLCVEIYFRYATGIRWTLIFLTLNYAPSMNYARLAIGWVMFLLPLLLLAYTLRRIKNDPIRVSRKRVLFSIGLTALLLLARKGASWLLLRPYQNPAATPILINEGTVFALFLLNTLGDYVLLALLGWMLAMWRVHRAQ